MEESKAMMLEKRLRQFDQQTSSTGEAPPTPPVCGKVASSAEVSPKAPKLSAPPAPEPAAVPSPKPPPAPLKAPTGVLNFTLQRALQVTLKKSEAHEGAVYLESAAAELGEVDMTHAAVGSVIYARLQVTSAGMGHPLTFLLHAFNRCEAEARAARHADVAEALTECLQQLVQYSALLLTVPDFVPAASTDSTSVLADALLNTSGPAGVRPSYLSHVWAAVVESGGGDAVAEVLTPVVDHLLAGLKPQPGQPLPAAGDATLRAVKALALLCSSKPAAASVAARPDFLLPTGQLLAPSLSQTGPAVERGTVLGLCLAPHVNLGVAIQQFPDPFRVSRQQHSEVLTTLLAPVHALQQQQAALLLGLLKGGSASKAAALKWVSVALSVNAAATAERPDYLKVSSTGFRYNLAACLLSLAQPVCGDLNKEAKISRDLALACWDGAYPSDVTPLVPLAEGAPPATAPSEEPNFITQSFFLAARAVHLSLVQFHYSFENLERHVSFLYGRAQRNGDDPAQDPQLAQHMKAYHVQDGLLHDPVLLDPCLALVGTMARWLHAAPRASMPHLPEHLLEDLCLMTSCAARAPPSVTQAASVNSLSGAPPALDSLFECALRFLSSGATLVHAPHLRAKLGDLLYEVYLSSDAKSARDQQRRAEAAPSVGPQHRLLLKHPSAVRDLAPALLDLYGAVEGLNAQDKNSTRVRVSCLLKYLWSSEEHRKTFRRITGDTATFVAFTNGLMNETNAHFLTVMEKLPEVRQAQTQMADGPAWAALPATERESISARLSENENWLKATLPVCNETFHMVWYLSSDAEIRQPFLSGVLVGRLASLLLSVLVQLVIRGLQIKVNNPEEYSFMPKEMLAKIARTCLHFSHAASFEAAVAASAYFQQNPTVLRKAATICRKHKLVGAEESDQLDAFISSVESFAAEARANDARMEDAPDNFLDPLLSEVMLDPVTLPSGMVIDRSTIETHLLNKPTDPFTNQPLSVDQLVPNHALKAEIEAWKASAIPTPTAAAAMSDE